MCFVDTFGCETLFCGFEAQGCKYSGETHVVLVGLIVRCSCASGPLLLNADWDYQVLPQQPVLSEITQADHQASCRQSKTCRLTVAEYQSLCVRGAHSQQTASFCFACLSCQVYSGLHSGLQVGMPEHAGASSVLYRLCTA